MGSNQEPRGGSCALERVCASERTLPLSSSTTVDFLPFAGLRSELGLQVAVGSNRVVRRFRGPAYQRATSRRDASQNSEDSLGARSSGKMDGRDTSDTGSAFLVELAVSSLTVKTFESGRERSVSEQPYSTTV